MAHTVAAGPDAGDYQLNLIDTPRPCGLFL